MTPREMLAKLEWLIAQDQIDFALNPKQRLDEARAMLRQMLEAVQEAKWELSGCNQTIRYEVAEQAGCPVNIVEDCLERNRRAMNILDKAELRKYKATP